MPNWSEPMQRTYEYYVVDPSTWTDVKKLDLVKSSTISRDAEAETLGSATIDVTESPGECYIRIYMITNQNGLEERHALGTFLVQTPGSNFDGKLTNISLDAYTPLLELKENPPPLGYSIFKNENIMSIAYSIIREQARAPVVETKSDKTLFFDFIADTSDTWLVFLKDLIANAKYTLSLDEYGRILFSPIQETASLQPVWTYNDDNSSILYPEVAVNHDMYGIPNVVEVVYSNGSTHYYAKAVNDDPNSPISTVARGRTITHRDSNPSLAGNPTQEEIQEYAERMLRELSTVEYTIKYSHGYCPVRIGDCVRLNYTKAGLNDIKAKVISQSIKCTPDCPVSETAVFTRKLWR